MKGLNVFLFCLLSYSALAAEKWAVVVGIGQYPAASGWNMINGDRDLELVVPMLGKLGFPRSHITTLANQSATKQNIKNALAELLPKLRRGDIVYFHFSGHGQLITDLNGDEADGYDEAMIPYDAKAAYDANGYKGENHLVDDELNVWLFNVRKKVGREGKILVVLDACHSGGGSRDEADEQDIFIVRGIRDKFRIGNAAYGTSQAVELSVDWVCISACRSDQRNYEYKTSAGQNYGRLSWALNQCLTADISAQALEEAIRRNYLELPVPPCPQDVCAEYPTELAHKSVL